MSAPRISPCKLSREPCLALWDALTYVVGSMTAVPSPACGPEKTYREVWFLPIIVDVGVTAKKVRCFAPSPCDLFMRALTLAT
ncbi:hypothetical protein MGN70_001725 [Eutypa lata]|nr:hypothetical protein MGN70_001725 [Eutypa lata]